MNSYILFLLVISILFFVLLIALRSLQLFSTTMSEFELKRLVAKNDEQALFIAHRELLLPDVRTLRHVLDAVATVILITLLVVVFGWFFGVIISVVIVLEASTIARHRIVQKYAQKIYDRYEEYILETIKKISPGLRFVREVSTQPNTDASFHSRDELLHVIDQAKTILSTEERYLLAHALKFEAKQVVQVMTPRSVVESISKDEVLGPVALDRLHKTGHSRFPVTSGDIDHVVGLLYSHDLIKHARSGKKVTAEKAMEQKVFYINENQTLDSALAGFLRVKHHLFIVVNEFEETTGVITIEDVIEALIGRKIVDEFDQYDDLRAVAKRAATTRNKSARSTHIS